MTSADLAKQIQNETGWSWNRCCALSDTLIRYPSLPLQTILTICGVDTETSPINVAMLASLAKQTWRDSNRAKHVRRVLLEARFYPDGTRK
ncbi:MAG: hypothetical protein PHH26_08220 [Candidatus Thermoplasmatota archaeon]|nr:hypothetical protein [Candidatus Thermoplasmatota archaeon]